MSLYETPTLIKTAKKIFPVSLWFRNRYFPTTDQDMFPGKQVLIEYKEGSRKMAPFVIPRQGGITMERSAYTATAYEPPYIAPQRPLTIDTLNQKGFGEELYENKTPEQRQAEVLGEDLADLSEMIDRREEWMCSELLQSGEVIMKHYAEEYGKGTPVEKVLRFYDKAKGFQNKYTPDTTWDMETATIYDDLDAMVSMFTKHGCPVADINMSAGVYSRFIGNEKIQKLLDNRSMHIGDITPIETPEGVAHVGYIIVRGKKLDIFVYDENYEDEAGTIVSFVKEGNIILTAPGMGRTLYGAISQIEESDHLFHTYRGMKIPKYLCDSKHETREIRVASAPVPVPNDRNGWVVAHVLGDD
ncbi:putative capsid protein of prophage [Lachnospiraceae bacterium KM106-2]|nr:putative capsid protein of prophage [Lachnospiraceae bacterium KM106-2]